MSVRSCLARSSSPVLAIAASLTVGSGAVAAPVAVDTLRVLFIGNSHTATHNIPDIVATFARWAGHEPVFDQVVIPGASLGDHLLDGRALDRIEESGWDVVVLQQGASALPESREALLGFARRFEGPIREAGAVPALYAVWPSRDRPGDFPASSDSYRLAAEATGGLFLPCGPAWTEAWDLDPELPLYAADGVHASRAGAYLAALVIYGALFDANPLDLAAVVPSGSGDALPMLDDRTAQTLREAAARALIASNASVGVLLER